MQDKEMDALFRSKLDNYEIEPSSKVWAKISDELGAPAKRKSIVPFLRIAASVAILITAGVYFIPKNRGVDPIEQPKNNGAIAFNPAVKPTVNVKQSKAVQQIKPAVQVQITGSGRSKPLVAAVRSARAAQAATTTQMVNPSVKQPVTNDAASNQPAEQPIQLIAAVDKPAVTNPVLPDGPISKPLEVASDLTSKTSVLAANDETKSAKKRKIRGLGGFINAVVGAIDKREDKLIEFTDTDEGDAVTGINLGIFKVKKVK